MTPFLGQGANSAVIDAFALCSMIARHGIERALPQFEQRRKRSIEKNVEAARSLAKWMTTTSDVGALAFRTAMRITPSALLFRSITAADDINDVDDLVAAIME